jgi:hypothetical protein
MLKKSRLCIQDKRRFHQSLPVIIKAAIAKPIGDDEFKKAKNGLFPDSDGD